MNDTELTDAIKDVEGNLESLKKAEPLGKQEKRRRNVLEMRRDTLLKIKEAREKGDKSEEFRQIGMYGLLTASEGKHPMFLRMARQRFGMNLF